MNYQSTSWTGSTGNLTFVDTVWTVTWKYRMSISISSNSSSYKKVFPTMVSCKVFTFSKSEATRRNNDWEMWYYKIPEMKKEGLWDGSGWAVDVPRMGTVLIIKNQFTVMMGWRGPVLVFRNQITAEHTVLYLQSSADLSIQGVSLEQTSGSPRVHECFHSHSQDMQLPLQPMLTLQQGSHL